MQKGNNQAGAFVHGGLIFLAALLPFFFVFLAGILLPPQYANTYYAELPEMVRRLEETEGNKIVVIGNSSVPFGVDSALCEELLQEGGEAYAVCNFGLYGTLGTKMMLDLAKDCLKEGDIVIFAPELTAQTLSLYFSAQETWYALDGNMGLFRRLTGTDRTKLIGNYAYYVSKKYRLWRSGQPAEGSGIYASASFNAHGDLLVSEREYNVMPDGADGNNPIVLSPSIFSADFIGYVNAYYAEIRGRGVRMYYSFPPMNEAALQETDPASLDEFYAFIRESFDFPVMSDISTRIMEKEYFYDSNFHLNQTGMIHHTVNLVEDIKNQLENTSKTEIVLPEKPIRPDESIEGEGDNSCADCFTYRREGNTWIIVGLTEAGAERSSLTVPYQVSGLYVKGFTADVFAGNRTVAEITLQENIASVPDNSFDGCRRLKKIILTHSKPSALSVGYSLLNGTNSKIYVQEAYVNTFINDYFWGYYEQKIVGY